MNALKFGIIGAGIAGLSCAKQLTLAGHEVVVFDKSHGVGGRMSHRYASPWEADHGAQYYTAQDPLFVNENTEWLQRGVVQAWEGHIVSYHEGNLSALKRETQRFVGVPGMTAPAKEMAKSLSTRLSQTVIEIKKSNSSWQIVTSENGLQPEKFDYVILAIPPIQAKHLLKPYSEQLAEICTDSTMHPCWTLLSFFHTPLPLNFDAAFMQHPIFSWLARDNSKPGRPPMEAWVAQASPEWSQAQIDLPKEEALKLLAQSFYEICPVHSDSQQVHLWRFAKLENESLQNFFIDHSQQLAVCGDWLRSSKVEDAWLSGYHLAKQITS